MRWDPHCTEFLIEGPSRAVDSTSVRQYADGRDFRYVRTASASPRVIRNCGIGGRGGFPVREMPVISRRTISSSVPGGRPASLGVTSAHPSVGRAGRIGTGPPASGRRSSGWPFASLGVWHLPHNATPSTTYFPRARAAPSSASSTPRPWATRSPTPATATQQMSVANDFRTCCPARRSIRARPSPRPSASIGECRLRELATGGDRCLAPRSAHTHRASATSRQVGNTAITAQPIVRKPNP